MPASDPASPAATPADDLALLVTAAENAADLALSFHGRAPQVWYKDEGAGPVTEADLAVDAMLRQRLTAARPGYGWLSEETPDTPDRLACEHAFIIDPIDGTRAFADATAGWGHSLAIVRNGQPVAAVVLMPMQEKLYTAALGAGARLNGTRLEASARESLEGARLLGSRLSLAAQHWPGGVPEVHLVQRSPLAYRLACLAEGGFDALANLTAIWEWDLAAGALLLTESGHILTDPDGNTLSFNTPYPRATGAVAANPAIHAALMSRRRS